MKEIQTTFEQMKTNPRKYNSNVKEIQTTFEQMKSNSRKSNSNAREIRTTFEQMKSMRQEVTKMAAGTVKNIRKVTLVCTRSYLREIMIMIMATSMVLYYTQ